MKVVDGEASNMRGDAIGASDDLQQGGQDRVQLGLGGLQLGQGRVLVLLAEGEVQVLDLR